MWLRHALAGDSDHGLQELLDPVAIPIHRDSDTRGSDTGRMTIHRSSGILLHPTSLPSAYGIGDFGNKARAFIDFLHDSGQTLWQVLPLTPTGYGDSPYQSISAFAGNTLLIDPHALVADGLLEPSDISFAPKLSDRVDFE